MSFCVAAASSAEARGGDDDGASEDGAYGATRSIASGGASSAAWKRTIDWSLASERSVRVRPYALRPYGRLLTKLD